MTVQPVDMAEVHRRSEARSAWMEAHLARWDRYATWINPHPFAREWRGCATCRATTCHYRTKAGHWLCHRALYRIMREAGLYPGVRYRTEYEHDAPRVVREELTDGIAVDQS